MEEDGSVFFIKSQKEGPTVQSVQASRSHHPGLLKHLYPLTWGFRKFSPKSLLLEALDAVSQSGTDENHTHHIVSEGCSHRLVSSEEPAWLWTSPWIRHCWEIKFRKVLETRVMSIGCGTPEKDPGK